MEDIPSLSAKLRPRDVLLRPLVNGICSNDIHEYVAGSIVTSVGPHVYTGTTNPQILGHEFSAIVADTSSKVSNVIVGERVSMQPLISPRDDNYGRRGVYRPSEKMGCVGLSWDWGGMVEPAALAIYAVDRGGVTSGSTVPVTDPDE